MQLYARLCRRPASKAVDLGLTFGWVGSNTRPAYPGDATALLRWDAGRPTLFCRRLLLEGVDRTVARPGGIRRSVRFSRRCVRRLVPPCGGKPPPRQLTAWRCQSRRCRPLTVRLLPHRMIPPFLMHTCLYRIILNLTLPSTRLVRRVHRQIVTVMSSRVSAKRSPSRVRGIAAARAGSPALLAMTGRQCPLNAGLSHMPCRRPETWFPVGYATTLLQGSTGALACYRLQMLAGGLVEIGVHTSMVWRQQGCDAVHDLTRHSV